MSSDDLHGVEEGRGEHQAWRRGVEQEGCAERARHSQRNSRRSRRSQAELGPAVGRGWSGRPSGVMAVRSPRLVGGGSLGGVRSRGEREREGKEKKERKDREEREREGRENYFRVFDFWFGLKTRFYTQAKKIRK